MRTHIFLALFLASLISTAYAADIQWTRFKGQVKALDLKANRITLQNKEGDLVGVFIDGDVRISRGSNEVALGDVQMDDKIVVTHIPVNPKTETKEQGTKGSDEPAPNNEQ